MIALGGDYGGSGHRLAAKLDIPVDVTVVDATSIAHRGQAKDAKSSKTRKTDALAKGSHFAAGRYQIGVKEGKLTARVAVY